MNQEVTGLKLWDKYLELFLNPGHKVTDIHKEWIGYSLRIFVDSVVLGLRDKDRNDFLNVLFNCYKKNRRIILLPLIF